MTAGGRATRVSTPNDGLPVRPFGRAHHSSPDTHASDVRAAVRIRGATQPLTPIVSPPFGSGGQTRVGIHTLCAAGPQRPTDAQLLSGSGGHGSSDTQSPRAAGPHANPDAHCVTGSGGQRARDTQTPFAVGSTRRASGPCAARHPVHERPEARPNTNGPVGHTSRDTQGASAHGTTPTGGAARVDATPNAPPPSLHPTPTTGA